jgi:hypothetical protein
MLDLAAIRRWITPRTILVCSIALTFWHRTRKPLIGGCVFVHFLIGLLCFVEPPAALLELPALAGTVELYKNYDFSQTWRMFAPPSQTIDEMGYSMEFAGGWTRLLPADQFLEEQGKGRFILPRGYLRLANHLRHPIFKEKKLKDEPFYFLYFQEMSAFYCFGDGAIPGLKSIRFYSVVKGIPPFFPTDGHGHPLPKAEDYDKVEALYQRRCDDR